MAQGLGIQLTLRSSRCSADDLEAQGLRGRDYDFCWKNIMNSSTLDTLPFECFWGQGEDTMFIFGCLEHEARCKKRKKKNGGRKTGQNLPRPWNGPQGPQFRKRRDRRKTSPQPIFKGLGTVKLWWPGSVTDVYSRFQEVGDWWLVIGGFLCFSWKQRDIT